ncbi:LacI family DNA-binding transcriptional regulator [Umezawaea sp. NPDC059074]|uniref:LacI family DNA-binding transcriptional regulator n=1 Tax=Umezawaea sp. NPDC059074 TaxID=3346716 RepID=UPI00368B73D5
MPVTIRDVARQARVSVSTVSRAISAPDLVRADTRERVLEVVRGLGYQPNPAARSLITGRTGNLGIVVPDLGNPFFPAVLLGVQARAREAGGSVFFCDSGQDPVLEEELIRTMARQVDGVVVCASALDDETLAELATLTTVVLVNRALPGVPSVLMDSASGMAAVVEHLAALGHRHCAYLNGPVRAWSNQFRRTGLREAARRTDVSLHELGPFDPTFAGGAQGVDAALAAGVTAIIAYNDLMALGVLSRLAELAVSVPERISVTGFDDILYAAMCGRPLTTVAMPAEAAGRAAVELLLDRLDHTDGAPGPALRELPTSLVIRATTAPPAGPAHR